MVREYVERVLRARVYDVARETPLDAAPRLSARLGNRVLIKREDLQSVFSFKLRGAYNKISGLTACERARGVVASSAGNHAQGVALAASRLQVDAVIVMPQTVPRIKSDAVAALGARIVLHGASYDDARQRASEIAADEGRVFVHPFDDPEVIAGQGTIGHEILRQLGGDIEAIFVPVGGGGMIAGIAAFVKSLWPAIQIIGVEPEDAASMGAALQAGERVTLPQVGLFADGVAVAQVGAEPFRIARQCVDEMLTVTTDEICAAIKDIYEDTRSIAEPAGALGVAGLKKFVQREGMRDRTLVAIDGGANVNFDRLRHIAERAEVGEQREALLAVTIPERPGALREFCDLIGERAVTEFNYRFADPGDAHIFVGLELRNGLIDRDQLVHTLESKGYCVLDLTNNEMAKIHVRYMVGGRARHVGRELLYRFDFPERPGALLNFLTHMGQRWNISLFHYRNHGADYGRVLIGLQVPDEEHGQLQGFLLEVGYPWVDESANPAYRLFLR